MVISASAVLLLGGLVWGLWRYAGLSVWHAVLCALFGFFLASTSVAPDVRDAFKALAEYLAGIDP